MLDMYEQKTADTETAAPIRRVRAVVEIMDLCATIVREWVVETVGRRGARRWNGKRGGDTMRSDVRMAVRSILRNPGFAAVVVVTLGLGIGVNTAIFSVVDTVVLRPLPFTAPDRLVQLLGLDTEQGLMSGHEAAERGLTRSSISYADFLEFREGTEGLQRLAGYRGGSWTLSGDGREPRRVPMSPVTNDFFDVLGVEPLLGRTFAPEEHDVGRNEVVVLSHSLWIQEFGGDEAVLGRSVMLAQRPYSVIGVMPSGFDYPYMSEMGGWLPFIHEPWIAGDTTSAGLERDWNTLLVIGRLADEASLANAEAEVQGIAAGLSEAYPRWNAELSAVLRPVQELATEGPRSPLLLLMGAVGAILLIACVNVASLLVARGTARRAEVAVRTALGASRGRLIRLFLTESLLYAAAGGVVGVALATGLLGLLPHLPVSAPRIHEVRIDLRVMSIVAVATFLTGIVFGTAPAWTATRSDLRGTLNSSGRGGRMGLTRSRLQRGLVVTEMALATTLAVGAGLLANSFGHIVGEEPGFDPSNVLTMRISLPMAYLDNPTDQWAESNVFFRSLETEVAELPGVDAVTLSYTNPLEPNTAFNTRFQITGWLEGPRPEQPFANLRTVTPSFFDTWRIPVLEGRAFTEDDRKESEGVAVVNETFARMYFGDEDPIGHEITGNNFWAQSGYAYPWRIVGVVGDVRSRGLDEDPAPAMYFPFAQAPMGNMRLIARTQGDPSILAPVIRQSVWDLDDAIPVDGLQTMEQAISDSVATPRFAAIAVGSFAALALLLAAVGVYGVLAYTVGMRTGEFGLRQALGANEAEILRLVMKHGLLVAGSGVALGLGAAALLAHRLDAWLYEVGALDLPTYGFVLVVMASAAGLACWLPARRATGADPAGALRSD